MKNPNGKVLIVDDEANILAGLADVLAGDGHQVQQAGSGARALEVLETYPCEVVVLDIHMPEMSGLELLAEIRQRWPHIRVLLLTGQGSLKSAMAAIKAGAHDYLLKPARPAEIRQAVSKAVVSTRKRRAQAQLLDSLAGGLETLREFDDTTETEPRRDRPARGRTLRIGALQIDTRGHEVRVGGVPVALTPTEFDLLVVLARRLGEVLEYRQLIRLGMGYDAERYEAKELVKRHIFSLRRKIEETPAKPRYLQNVRGVGYRLVRPE